MPGVNFVQKGKSPVTGLDGIAYEGSECHKCHLIGHCTDQCPQIEQVVQTFQLNSLEEILDLSPYIVAPGTTFNQIKLSDRLKTIKPLITHLKDIILLDAGSTVHLVMNKALVTNVSRSTKTLELKQMVVTTSPI